MNITLQQTLWPSEVWRPQRSEYENYDLPNCDTAYSVRYAPTMQCVLRIQGRKNSSWTSRSLKMNALRSFETSARTSQKTWNLSTVPPYKPQNTSAPCRATERLFPAVQGFSVSHPAPGALQAPVQQSPGAPRPGINQSSVNLPTNLHLQSRL